MYKKDLFFFAIEASCRSVCQPMLFFFFFPKPIVKVVAVWSYTLTYSSLLIKHTFWVKLLHRCQSVICSGFRFHPAK